MELGGLQRENICIISYSYRSVALQIRIRAILIDYDYGARMTDFFSPFRDFVANSDQLNEYIESYSK